MPPREVARRPKDDHPVGKVVDREPDRELGACPRRRAELLPGLASGARLTTMRRRPVEVVWWRSGGSCLPAGSIATVVLVNPVAPLARGEPPDWSGGRAALTRLGGRLPAVAAQNALSAGQLRTNLLHDKSLLVDPDDHLLYIDPPAAEAGRRASDSGALLAQVDPSEAFTLHSRPGSSPRHLPRLRRSDGVRHGLEQRRAVPATPTRTTSKPVRPRSRHGAPRSSESGRASPRTTHRSMSTSRRRTRAPTPSPVPVRATPATARGR